MKLLSGALALFLSFGSGYAKGQGPNPSPGSSPARGLQDFTFVLEDGATHRGLGFAPVVIKLSSDDGVLAVAGTTDPKGTITATLDPANIRAATVHVDGYDELTQKWTGSESLTKFSLHENPQAMTSSVPQAASAGSSDAGAAPGFGPDSGSDSGTASGPDLKTRLRTAAVQFLFVILPVLVSFLLREIAVRTVHLFMMRRGAPKPAVSPVEEPGPPPEVSPAFLEMNTLNGLLLSGPAEARLLRAERTSGRKLRIFEISLLIQVCGLASAAGLIAWLMPKSFAESMAAIGSAAAVLLVVDVLLAFYAWTSWLQDVRVLEALCGLSVVTTIGITMVATIGMTMFGVRFKIPTLILIPAIVQLAYLVLEFRKLRRDARKDGNRKLVILRVFGSDKNTAFTFGKLMEQWRYVGSFLTIVDPSYIRHRFSIFARGSAGRSLGTTMAVGILSLLLDQFARFAPGMFPQLLPASWASLPAESVLVRVRGILLVGVAVIALIPLLVSIWRHFLKSPAQAFAGVERVERAKLSIETDYHGSPFFCFDDVWQPAVRKMLSVADVVLMDLRGFSAQRQGCAYELGELVDHYPVDRLLFLVDASTPRDLLQKLILERWVKMRADSPNRAIAEPIVQLYETADRSASDIHHIASLLSASLEGQVQARAQLTYWGG